MQEIPVQPDQIRQGELFPVTTEVFLRPRLDFTVALIAERVQLPDLLPALRRVGHGGKDPVLLLFRHGGVLILQGGNRGTNSSADDLLQLADADLQRIMAQVLQKNLLQLRTIHQDDPGHSESLLRKDSALQAIQKALQFFHEFQGAFEPRSLPGFLPLRFLHEEIPFQGGVTADFRHPGPHTGPAPAFESSLHDTLDTQIRQDLGDIRKEQRVRRQDHHVLGPERVTEGIEQIGNPMEGDSGFPAARRALDHQIRIQRMANDDILLRLDGVHYILQAVGGHAAQRILQIILLRDDVAVEEAEQTAAPDGQHPLQRQFSADLSVGRFIIHGADLAGIIEIGNRGAPVHDHRIQRDRIQDAPAAQIPGFRRAAGRDEIQPGKKGLGGSQTQLAEPVQLNLKQLHGHLLLLIRILLHLYVRALPGLRAGQGFQVGDFTVDHVAGPLKTAEFFFRIRMIGKICLFHISPFDGETAKSLCRITLFAEAYSIFGLQACGVASYRIRSLLSRKNKIVQFLRRFPAETGV